MNNPAQATDRVRANTATHVNAEIDRFLATAPQDPRVVAYVDRIKKDAAEKLSRLLGWMTRAHPYVLDGTR